MQALEISGTSKRGTTQLPTIPEIGGTIMHQGYGDRQFEDFGLRGNANGASLFEIMHGGLRESMGNALDRFGCIVAEDVNVGHGDLAALKHAGHQILPTGSGKDDVIGNWHTDGLDFALYCPPQDSRRLCQTGVAGRTHVIRTMVQQAGILNPPDEKDDFYYLHPLALWRRVLEEGTEYDRGFGSDLKRGFLRLHSGADDETTDSIRRFRQAVHGALGENSLMYAHSWEDGQLLLVSAEALHCRIVPDSVPHPRGNDGTTLLRISI